jgi:hypothetical protein
MPTVATLRVYLMVPLPHPDNSLAFQLFLPNVFLQKKKKKLTENGQMVFCIREG